MLIAKIAVIKKLREKKNLSRRALSQLSGLPDNAISRIENNSYETTHPLRAKEIAKALGVDVHDIFSEIVKEA